MKEKNIRAFLFCATAFASFFVIMLCAVGYATVFLRSAGENKAATGTIVAVACIVSALIQPVLGHVSDRLPSLNWRRVSFLLGFLLLAAFITVYFSGHILLVASFSCSPAP